MVKMQPMEDKDFEPRKNNFSLGVHEVAIQSGTTGKTPNII